jgi:hypothetical protein
MTFFAPRVPLTPPLRVWILGSAYFLGALPVGYFPFNAVLGSAGILPALAFLSSDTYNLKLTTYIFPPAGCRPFGVREHCLP